MTTSKCDNGHQYRRSIEDARTVYDLAEKAGFELEIIDIGGGFIGTDDKFFENVATIVNNSIADLFSDTRVKVKTKS